ncbi:MAG: hypothetical protein QM784_31200 [Polyangiaceae bacterium]
MNKVEELASKMRGYVDALSYTELRSPYLSAPEVGEVRSVLAEVVALYEPIASLRNIGLRIETRPRQIGEVSRSSLLVVLTTLLSYAIHGTRAGETIEIDVEVAERRPLELEHTDCVQIVVNAPGCAFFGSQSLERCDVPSLADPTILEGMQVALVCSSLCRVGGGKVEFSAPEVPVGHAVVYWPIVEMAAEL